MIRLSDLTALADEIALDTGLDTEAAVALAWDQMPALLADIDADTRWAPAQVVVFDLYTAAELAKLTDR
jgi:hypothetical protein